jgi:spore coat polysaccharide biosynthesis predicted glycosyltransferase SpsG
LLNNVFRLYNYKDKKGNYSKQNKPLKDIKTDKIIDHVFIVTKINTSTKSYNRILVTGNTTTYANKGLGKINEDSLYKRKVEFYILRPVFYVEKP